MEGAWVRNRVVSLCCVQRRALMIQAKHQLTHQNLTLEAKLELPPVQEFISLTCAPPGEHN